MWPLNSRVGPPPVPRMRPMQLYRPGSNSCITASMPASRSSRTQVSAMGRSLPVRLGTFTSSQVISVQRSGVIEARIVSMSA